MPWKTKNVEEQRWEVLQEIRFGKFSVSELSRRYHISRKTVYKWRQRFREKGVRGLKDQQRIAKRVSGRPSAVWLRRIRRARRRRPTWGARKLHWMLEEQFGSAGLPSVAAIGRWLKLWGFVATRRRPRKRGPIVARTALRPAMSCNETWTVDFKGWFRAGNGERCEPLTVRDMFSSFVLCIRLLKDQSVEQTQRQFVKIFNKYGLPRRIRCDNGCPFGGVGPTGLTRLSAWWIKLGIDVEFITPGCPGENGAHEQFHRVYKRELQRKPSKNRQSQQRRSDLWRWDYNHRRPYGSVKMNPPSRVYRKSHRKMPIKIHPFRYGPKFERRWVKGNGEIRWHSRRWFVGEAFVRDYVGLKQISANKWQVYFCNLLVGELHQNDSNPSIRPATYQRR